MTAVDHANALAFARAFAKGELEAVAEAQCAWCRVAGDLGSAHISKAQRIDNQDAYSRLYPWQHVLSYVDDSHDTAGCQAHYIWARVASLAERSPQADDGSR